LLITTFFNGVLNFELIKLVQKFPWIF